MRRLALAVALAIALAGCGGDDEARRRGAEELTVSAASSLTEAFEAYGEETEIEEKFSFAGSDDLAAQIREGAPVDVFASANTSLPDALYEEGSSRSRGTSSRTSSCWRCPRTRSADGGDGGVDALMATWSIAALDIVIGAEGVPVGDYTREVLASFPEDEARRSSTMFAPRSPT